MVDPKSCMTKGISTGELERRWSLLREQMAESKIDYLLMRGDEEYLGGYIRWISDFSTRHNYPATVIFPRDDEMTLISNGPFPPEEPSPPAWAVRGVKERLSAPFFPTAHYTSAYEAQYAVDVLNEKKNAVIGLVGKSYIPVNFYEHLVKHLPAATFVDMTEPVDRLKAIRSPEEIELIKATAALQDGVIEDLQQKIRPGMREFEVFAMAEQAATIRGSERQLVLVGSAPQGTHAPFKSRRFQNRVIEEGDQVSVLIEVNGPGGLYTEIARIFTLGPPSQELVDAFSDAVEAQEHSLQLLAPGAAPADIFEANNAFLHSKGYPPELRLHAHGQGYDLLERPLFIKDETMSLQEGMNLTVHPMVIHESVWAVVCDNYIIGSDGPGECLHRTPKKIISISQ